MGKEHVEPLLDSLSLNRRREVYSQQDGAPSHNAVSVGNYLHHLFHDKWIANRGPLHWPERSQDLTPLDFFLSWRIKDLTYRRCPNPREGLQAEINDARLCEQCKHIAVVLIQCTRWVDHYTLSSDPICALSRDFLALTLSAIVQAKKRLLKKNTNLNQSLKLHVLQHTLCNIQELNCHRHSEKSAFSHQFLLSIRHKEVIYGIKKGNYEKN